MATISATANSLLKQRFTDYEWLVVDGASKDKTLQLIDGITVPNKRVFSAPDNGIYDAMNKGIGLARGDWVYFLNSGDEFQDDEVLSSVSAAIDEKPGVELLWGDMLYTNGRSSLHLRFRHISNRSLIFNDLNHQSTFVNRKLFKRCGNFNQEFKTSADYDWLIRAFRGGASLCYFPRIIARFAIGGAHSIDPNALFTERQRLRLQYISPVKLQLGLFFARISRRLRMGIGYGGCFEKNEV